MPGVSEKGVTETTRLNARKYHIIIWNNLPVGDAHIPGYPVLIKSRCNVRYVIRWSGEKRRRWRSHETQTNPKTVPGSNLPICYWRSFWYWENLYTISCPERKDQDCPRQERLKCHHLTRNQLWLKPTSLKLSMNSTKLQRLSWNEEAGLKSKE